MPNRYHLEKPVLTVSEFIGESVKLARQLPTIAGVYAFRTVSPALREELWVAVSAENNCRYCSFVHQDWAKRAGVSNETVCELEQRNFAHLSPREKAAARFLTEWIANDFQRVSDKAYGEFKKTLLPSEQRRVKALGRMINLFNRTGNTADALLSRLNTEPYQGSRMVDEAVISSLFIFVTIFILPVLSLRRRESPKRLVRDFLSFSSKFDKRLSAERTER